MRWEFTWTRQAQRCRKVLTCLGVVEGTDCSGQALEAEGFELIGVPFLSVARSSCWTEKGTPYGVHDAQHNLYVKTKVRPLPSLTTSGYSLSTLPVYT